MRTANRIDTESSAASYNGDAWSVEHLEGYSVVASLTGNPSGTLKLQVSNNAYLDNVNLEEASDAVWVDLGSSSQNVAASGTFAWNVADAYYRAVRMVWTRSGGTGTVTAYWWGKGAQS